MFNNYSSPGAHIGYEMVDSQRGYNHLISNECQWNNYIIDLNHVNLCILQKRSEDDFCGPCSVARDSIMVREEEG